MNVKQESMTSLHGNSYVRKIKNERQNFEMIKKLLMVIMVMFLCCSCGNSGAAETANEETNASEAYEAALEALTDPNVKKIKSGDFEVGDVIELGGYTWTVLNKDDGYALCITTDVIDYRPFNNQFDTRTWEFCTLREYLNGDFYEKTFTDEEKSVIPEKEIDNIYKSDGEFVEYYTNDKVFLLSRDELETFMPDAESRVAGGDWKHCHCYLRSQTLSNTYFADCFYMDKIDEATVDNDLNIGLRPAIYVECAPHENLSEEDTEQDGNRTYYQVGDIIS